MIVGISPSLLSASRSRIRRGRWMAKTKLAKNEWKWQPYDCPGDVEMVKCKVTRSEYCGIYKFTFYRKRS